LCIPSINKLVRSFLTIFVLQLPLQRFRLLLQKLFTMPGKRKVNYSSRSVFWPCGDCRNNCIPNSVQCDTCNSWYHYSWQQLDLPDIEYIIRPDASFTCRPVILLKLDSSPLSLLFFVLEWYYMFYSYSYKLYFINSIISITNYYFYAIN
jgi:hypothetical protein